MAPSAGDLLSQDEFWIFSFILGWATFNWPLLTLTVGKNLFGVPLVLIHVVIIWLLIILLLYLFNRLNSDNGDSDRRHMD